jgi:8-oxo-dGTP pyrophosphatase MutT (NUDIX family)
LGGHATDSDQTAAHTAAREFIEETCDDDTNLSQEEIELIDILTKHLQTQPSIPVFGNAIRQFVCRFSDLPLRIQQRIPALNERKTLQNKEIKEIYWERIDQITKENGFPPPIIEGLKNSLKENLFRDQSLTLQPKR